MTRQQDLDRLGHAIKDAEARQKVFVQTLETVNKEFNDLSRVEKALEENLEFLKTKKIIALASEYKKAKEDLIKTKARMVKIRFDSERIGAATRECEEFLRKSKEDYSNTLKGPTNILKFRRKNAQK